MKHTMKVVVAAVGVILVALAVVLAQLMVRHAPASIDYADLLMIILTVLSIMITVLGIGLAVIGVIGWSTFESKLRDNSFKYFTSELGKDGGLRREFEAIITDISLQGVERLNSKKPDGDESAGKDKDYVD